MAAQLDAQLVYAVNRDDSAAWDAIIEICESRPRPGQVIPLTGAQFKALRRSVIVLQMPPKPS